MSEQDSSNTSDPPAAAAAAVTTPPANANEAEKVIKPIQMPTIEEVRGQDIWNNCAIRSVASGIMGTTFILQFFLSFCFYYFKNSKPTAYPTYYVQSHVYITHS